MTGDCRLFAFDTTGTAPEAVAGACVFVGRIEPVDGCVEQRVI